MTRSIMKKLNGHWFCDHCDDIVFCSHERPCEGMIACPACGHIAAHFVPHKINRKVLGENWFENMRLVAAQQDTPELPTQGKKGDNAKLL
jgi:hypothetical protein